MDHPGVEHGRDVYYDTGYWNEYEEVRRHLRRRIGDESLEWPEYFQACRGGRVFERGLILNCGNGHVERTMIGAGVLRRAVGVDYAADLLDDARRAAEEAGIDATYHRMDTNTADFPAGDYDLVVNYAAGHHVARVDAVFRALAALLPDDGWLVSYDYVGPHRNQYPADLWEAAWQVNERLPETVRQDMVLPHEPTMLATDPTEAIHSELVEATIERYFALEERVALGGGIAYLLLTANPRLAAAAPAERDAAIREVLAADIAHLEAHPEHNCFTYAAGRPRRDLDPTDLDRWTAEEDAREAAASATGRYYDRSAHQATHEALSDARLEATHLRATMEEFRARIGELEDERGGNDDRLRAAEDHVALLKDALDNDRAELARLQGLLADGVSGAVRRAIDARRGKH